MTCASRCWGSRRRGRTPAERARATCSRRRTPPCSWTAATACSPSCARRSTTSTSTRWSSPTCTPTTSSTWCPYSYALTYAPRQQPVPVPPWPGTDKPAKPRLIAPPGARETFRRVVGAWGNEDLIENAFALEEYEESSTPEVGPLRFAFRSVPHFTETFAIRVSNGRGTLAYGADSRPVRGAVQVREGLRPVHRRGDAAAPRAHRHPRPPDARGGRRARQAGRGQARGAHAHLRRARRHLGAGPGVEGLRPAGGRRPRRRRLRGLSAAATAYPSRP